MNNAEIEMRKPHAKTIWKAVVKDWRLYVLLLPLILWFAVWAYKPMGGLLIALKSFFEN